MSEHYIPPPQEKRSEQQSYQISEQQGPSTDRAPHSGEETPQSTIQDLYKQAREGTELGIDFDWFAGLLPEQRDILIHIAEEEEESMILPIVKTNFGRN